jgi:hypothetical protein
MCSSSTLFVVARSLIQSMAGVHLQRPALDPAHDFGRFTVYREII